MEGENEMGFWNIVKDTAEEAGKKITTVASDNIEIAKCSSAIKECKERIKGIYMEIGERYYNAEDNVTRGAFGDLFEKIQYQQNELKGLEKRLQDLKGVKLCKSCGKEISTSSRFCKWCGLPVETDEPEDTGMSCPNCHAPLTGTEMFCGECGAKIEWPSKVAEQSAKEVKKALICSECGQELKETDLFCKYCGTPVKKAETENVSMDELENVIEEGIKDLEQKDKKDFATESEKEIEESVQVVKKSEQSETAVQPEEPKTENIMAEKSEQPLAELKKSVENSMQLTKEPEQNKILLFCSECGRELKETDAFCKYCGTPVKKMQAEPEQSVEEIKKPLTCAVCGEVVKEMDAFCKNCGNPINR